MREGSYRALSVTAILALGVGFFFATTVPPERVQGEFAKIMFVHVPSAWLAFLAFAVTMIGGAIWLIRKTPIWDRLAAASAEVGVFYTALALLTGMIWGYPVWGTFWDWSDARMMSTAIMFFVYVGYLALRRSIPDPEIPRPAFGHSRHRCVHSGAAGLLLGDTVSHPSSRSNGRTTRCAHRSGVPPHADDQPGGLHLGVRRVYDLAYSTGPARGRTGRDRGYRRLRTGRIRDHRTKPGQDNRRCLMAGSSSAIRWYMDS